MPASIEWAQSQDGSWTCFNHAVQEHYHNLHGAYNEAVAIYAEPSNIAERLAKTPHIRVLDPFFGLGYNTLACMAQFWELKQTQFPEATLSVMAFEYDPEIVAMGRQIFESDSQNPLNSILTPFAHKIYYQTHGDPSPPEVQKQNERPLGIHFELRVGDTRALVQALEADAYDLIYHDAFSPHKQPELWTQQLFEQYYRILDKTSGTVLTYSAAACIRHAFLLNGFHTYPHVTRAYKPGTLASVSPRSDLPRFTDLETALIHSKSGIPYEDNEALELPSQVIQQNRQAEHMNSSLPGSSQVHRTFS